MLKYFSHILYLITAARSYSGNVIFYNAHTQYENLGDLIINLTLLRKLRNYGQLIVNVTGVPEWYCEQLEITANERASKYGGKFRLLVLLFSLGRLFKFNANTYFIIHPGHYYGKGGLLRSGELVKSLLYFFILRITGVRICRFGASIGPFSKVKQIAEKWQSRLMYFYSVRESISEEYARTIGVAQIAKFPDLAWLMQKPQASLVQSNVEGEYVIFSFRESTLSSDGSIDYKNKLYTVLDEAVKLICGEWCKHLVISYQVERDYELCQELNQRYRDSYNVVLIERKVDSECMYELYSRAFMVFSNRLHVLMFAVACGSLPVAVIDAAKHDKITGIFSDAKLMRLIIDICKGSFEVEGLHKIAADAHLIKEEISLCSERQRKVGDALIERVMTGKIK